MGSLLPSPTSVLPVSIADEDVEFGSKLNLFIDELVDAEGGDVVSRAWIVFNRDFGVLVCCPVDVFAVCGALESSEGVFWHDALLIVEDVSQIVVFWLVCD